MVPVATANAAPLLGEPLPVELMNTIWADRDGKYDALDTVGGAGGWLAAVRDRLSEDGRPAPPARVTGAVQAELRALRDALRTLAAVVTDDPRAAADASQRLAAVAVVNRLGASAPVWAQLAWPPSGGPTRVVRSGGSAAEVALAGLAEQAVALFAGPLAAELRACLAPGCVLYFVRDHPRREWCSAACGNRARVARHYRRHRAAD